MKTPLTIPTAEPFLFPGGKIGCLLVHGFTGAPKEMRWMGEYLHRRNFTVLGIRLAAHATNPEDMLRARWHDWLASVEDGLNILKDMTQHQFVMGLSMGGILSLIAAARYDIKGVVAISTPFSLPPDPRLKIIKLLYRFIPKVPKGESDFRNKNAEKDHVDYPYYPTRSIIELLKLLNEMRNSLGKIRKPVLLIQSRGDKGIPAESMDEIYNHLSVKDKSRLWVTNSGHVVTREPDREIAFKAAEQFIKRVISK